MTRATTVAVTALAAVLAVLAIAGAPGAAAHAPKTRSAAHGAKAQSASLVLDFTPNAIHSGIYLALKRHYDTANGVKLHVIIPGESTDAITLLADGRVNFAILDIHDLAIADAQGRKLVGVMAIVERPLAAVIAQSRYRSPRDLAGQTVGVTGDPSDLAVLHSIVAGSGGNPAKVKTITIGYDAVPDLLDGRVAAATAFWNDEGVQLAHQKPGAFNVFRVEDYGAPPYPELVVCATRAELQRDPSLARGLVHALVEGYDGVLRDPKAGEQALESQVSGLAASAVSQQLTAELPAFRPQGGGAYGTLVPSVLRAWARWELKFGIVKKTPDIATMFDRSFLPR
ncbi:MAG TPA: ABC transporter substrate-binding protein [Solirubrobacteraceae bacterium]|nr:ABC transporter substrate-binding protein [Solirubrobacteraceae bacterium]